MSDTVDCANCGEAVLVGGRTARAYYEYASLPFPVGGSAVPGASGRSLVCADCDLTLRRTCGLPPRGSGRA